ncbi:hypothetical protein [Methylobacterium sp. WL9]|uniref:hypothetical protein n=1 Tax=Methylobacterium sp. WL9 TaxID=2603898 RepID=UPI0011CBDB10|nr:hypothetical protein [Methylobacterium sp. WL9]TXN19169.1 hypothetical protein FV217_22230 [Methylobacterium sp. WL9]
MLVASLDVIAQELELGERSTAPSNVLQRVLTDARASALALAEELKPACVAANRGDHSATLLRKQTAILDGESNVIPFRQRRA